MPSEAATTTTHEITEDSFKNSDIVPDEFIDQEGDFF